MDFIGGKGRLFINVSPAQDAGATNVAVKNCTFKSTLAEIDQVVDDNQLGLIDHLKQEAAAVYIVTKSNISFMVA